MILRIVCAVLALAFLVLVGWLLTPARAHYPGCEGDCQQWMMGLKNTRTDLCCEYKEATALSDVDWDTQVVDGKDHYRVRLDGKWTIVPDWAVVNQPNRLGPTLVWLYREKGLWMVRCFLRGAEG